MITYADYCEMLEKEKELTEQVNAEFDPFAMVGEYEPTDAEKQLNIIRDLINYYCMVNCIEVYDETRQNVIDRVKTIDDAIRKYGVNVFCMTDVYTDEWTVRRYSDDT